MHLSSGVTASSLGMGVLLGVFISGSRQLLDGVRS